MASFVYGAMRAWPSRRSSSTTTSARPPGSASNGKGKWVVTWAGVDNVHVWDLATGKRVVQVTTRKGRVGSQLNVAFVAPDDSLWVGVPGKTLHWSLPSGEPLPSHETALFLGPGCFSVDGKSCLVRIGAGDFGKGIGLASLGGGGEPQPLVADPRGMAIASFEPTQGKIVAVWADSTISLFEASSQSKVYSEATGAPVKVLGMATDRGWLLSMGDHVSLTSLRAGGETRKVSLRTDSVPLRAILDAKGKLVLMHSYAPAEQRHELTVWKILGQRLERSAALDSEQDSPRSFALSPKGDLLALATARPAVVKLISTETWRPKSAIAISSDERFPTQVVALEFHPRRALLAVAMFRARESGILMVDTDKGQITFELPWPAGVRGVNGIRFNASGALLGATAFQDEVLVFDLAARRIKTRLKLNGLLSNFLDFSPDSRLLACGRLRNQGFKSASDITLFELASATLLCQVPGHSERLSALYFLKSGKVLMSSASDGSSGCGARRRRRRRISLPSSDAP